MTKLPLESVLTRGDMGSLTSQCLHLSASHVATFLYALSDCHVADDFILILVCRKILVLEMCSR